MSPREVVKVCGCGREHTREGWAQLRYVGVQRDEVEHIELRDCPCGSTIGIVVYRNPEVPTEAA